MNGWDMYEKMTENMDADTLLRELVYALPDDELRDYMEFIARNNDIELDEE